MHALPGMTAIGVRFSIDEIERVYDTAGYGSACWEVFWRAVDIHKLAGTMLFEGDTAATLSGRENVYCLGVQSVDGNVAGLIRLALSSSTAFAEVAASPPLIDGAALNGEPLPEAGTVSATGELLGSAYNSRPGLERAQAAAPAPAPPPPVPSITPMPPAPVPAELIAAPSGDAQTKRKRDPLFTGRGWAVAGVVSVAYLVLGVISVNLPFSAFSCRDSGPEEATQTVTAFWLAGLISGLVGYNVWRSERLTAILRGFAIWGLVGAAAGLLWGALGPLSEDAAGVANMRAAMIAEYVARFAALAMGISVLFTSHDRRLMLKSLFVPMAAALTLGHLLFTLVPLDAVSSTALVGVVQESAGNAAGLALVVAVVVVIVRIVKGKRQVN